MVDSVTLHQYFQKNILFSNTDCQTDVQLIYFINKKRNGLKKKKHLNNDIFFRKNCIIKIPTTVYKEKVMLSPSFTNKIKKCVKSYLIVMIKMRDYNTH